LNGECRSRAAREAIRLIETADSLKSAKHSGLVCFGHWSELFVSPTDYAYLIAPFIGDTVQGGIGLQRYLLIGAAASCVALSIFFV